MTHTPPLPLLIIDPAIRAPSRAAHERIAALCPQPPTVVCPALADADVLVPLAATAFSGMIVLGSAASVNDPLPWLAALKAWLRPVAQGGAVPILGICFGHQLLADVLGGQVARLFPQPIKGFRTLTLATAPMPWWPERAPTVRLFHSHGEAVGILPPGARVLAESPLTLPDGGVTQVVEALAYDGLPIWSFQPHPESTPDFLTEQGCAELLAQPETVQGLADGWDIVTAFVQFCQRGTATEAAFCKHIAAASAEC